MRALPARGARSPAARGTRAEGARVGEGGHASPPLNRGSAGEATSTGARRSDAEQMRASIDGSSGATPAPASPPPPPPAARGAEPRWGGATARRTGASGARPPTSSTTTGRSGSSCAPWGRSHYAKTANGNAYRHRRTCRLSARRTMSTMNAVCACAPSSALRPPARARADRCHRVYTREPPPPTHTHTRTHTLPRTSRSRLLAAPPTMVPSGRRPARPHNSPPAPPPPPPPPPLPLPPPPHTTHLCEKGSRTIKSNQESIKPRINQTENQSNRESIKPRINQTENQSNRESIKPRTNQTENQSNRESIKPRINQTENQSNRESIKPRINKITHQTKSARAPRGNPSARRAPSGSR